MYKAEVAQRNSTATNFCAKLQWSIMRGMMHPSERAANFHYAIRNVVSAAEVLERRGRRVIHLNIGDPQAFGFKPPPEVIEAVERAIHDKFTGYSHSAGLRAAREVVVEYASSLGTVTAVEDVVITSGASEAAAGIRLPTDFPPPMWFVGGAFEG